VRAWCLLARVARSFRSVWSAVRAWSVRCWRAVASARPPGRVSAQAAQAAAQAGELAEVFAARTADLRGTLAECRARLHGLGRELEALWSYREAEIVRSVEHLSSAVARLVATVRDLYAAVSPSARAGPGREDGKRS